MRPSWKLVGLAGLAGVAATGVIIARRRREQRDYDPAELRERLHRRLAESGAAGPQAASSPPAGSSPPAESSPPAGSSPPANGGH